ncbi:class I SAM-dependent methyltransferase [Yoonia vestfoldensis]|nr:class I SAM-dependent methyltransferase [Yoonia vestfoldensis]
MVKVHFGTTDTTTAAKPCPMCAKSDSSPLLQVESGSYSQKDLHMNLCQQCGTAYFTDDDPVDGYDTQDFAQDYWYNYVQNGAGISAMLEPIFALKSNPTGSLLDIGCGFGYVPHFWQTMGRGDAIGLEMSAYGRIGAEKLGITVVPEYYANAEAIKDRRFDYVYSSEVIEHVEDPFEFIKEISTALSDDGILILTTPSATILTPTSNKHVVLATLSPGFHYFVSSKSALSDLLTQSGFDHVKVHDCGHRLFAWASRKALPDIEIGFSAWDLYLDYLKILSDNADHHVAGGAVYRGMKDSYNLGKFDRADWFYECFKKVAKEGLDLDLADIKPALDLSRNRKQLDNHLVPSWMGCALLYAGLIEGRHGHSVSNRLRLISGSIEVMQKEIDLGAQFAGEPAFFIEVAKQEHQKLSYLDSEIGGDKTDIDYTITLRQPRPMKGRDVCIFAAYTSSDRISDATANYINELQNNKIDVILCLAMDNPAQALDLGNINNDTAIILRKNNGYDFGSWTSCLKHLADWHEANRVLLVNDSMFLLPDLLPTFLKKCGECTEDFIAATESYVRQHHAQTYFMILQNKALQSIAFRNFIENFPFLSNKSDVIQNYEISLLSSIKNEFNLSTRILFPMNDLFCNMPQETYAGVNVSHSYWDHLVSQGLPFIKVELIRDNPLNVGILNWKTVFLANGGSVSSAIDHMSIPRDGKVWTENQPRSHTNIDLDSSKKNRSEFLTILKELNRVRLNARARRRDRAKK